MLGFDDKMHDIRSFFFNYLNRTFYMYISSVQQTYCNAFFFAIYFKVSFILKSRVRSKNEKEKHHSSIIRISR